MKVYILFEILFLVNNIMESTQQTNYESVGCFAASVECGHTDVFAEKGLTLSQCESAIASIPWLSCSAGGVSCINSYVYTSENITAEACLQICNTNGFKYTGLHTAGQRNFCYCGNTIKYPSNTSDICNQVCLGNSPPALRCGTVGLNYLSVYSKGTTKVPAPRPSTSSAVPFVESLTHYWPIENSTMTDRVGSSHMTQGSATYFHVDRFGNPNSALYLLGGWTQVPSGNYLDSAQFTISLWMKPQPGYLVRILDFGDGGGPNNAISFGLDGLKPYISLKSTSGGLASNTQVALNYWQFIVATYDGTNVRIYLNGRKEMTKPSDFTPSFKCSSCIFGKSNYNNEGYSTSALDDLRFYNRALTDSEVMQLMNYDPSAKPCQTSTPCLNNGVCTNDNMGGYKCTCLAGFTGANCQTVSSPCTLSPNVCENGGTCTSDNKGGYTCKCPNSYTGTNCQTALPCQTSKPCLNNGVCTNDNMGGYKCTCLAGFTGTNCQTALASPCTLNPNQCQNGGKCINNNLGGYTCNCTNGYTGTNCQTLLPCNLVNKCQNGGNCNNDFKGGYMCACTSGFTGVNCELTQTTLTTTTKSTPPPYISSYFQNVGCYKASDPCNYNDVFVELGISLTQCAAAASARSMVCYVSTCNYSQINSSKSMTVDTCLQICSANNFKYAGLQSWSGKNFCGCGNTIKFPVDIPGACTSPCNGNTAQYCGDRTGMNWSVYNVKASFSSSTTPRPK